MLSYLRGFSLIVVLLFCAWSLGAQSLPAQDKVVPGSKTVATVDGAAISEEELNRAAAADLEKLEMQKVQFEASLVRNRHQILENALNALVEGRLVDAEAARQGISRKELLAREVDQKITSPTPEEVSRFYEANKDRIRAPMEQVSAQIQQYLKQQNQARIRQEFIDRLKKDKRVTIALEPLRQDVAVAGHPIRGAERAPVTIVEFSDFQCPFCRSFNTTLNRLRKEYPTDVRIVFRQFPLSEIHPMAEKAAEASLCAQDQGKFWEMHDLMFTDQTALKVDDLKAKAASLGLDATAFGSCLDSGKYEQAIRQEIRDGMTLGTSGTPAYFINGRFFSGALPYDEIAAVIKEELRKKSAGVTTP